MAKGQSPLLGYNTNVRHKGRVFHIQTEDSGVAHPHVITHLFADGGRILKSNKTSYADLLDAPDLQPQVKRIMQDQHKAMFIALRDGQFDHLIDPGGAARESAVPTPSTEADATVRTSALPTAPRASAVPTAPAPATPPPVPAAARASSVPAMPAAAPKPMPAPPATSAPAAPVTGVRPSVTMPAVTAPAAAAPAAPKPATPPSTPSPASGSGKYAPVRSPEILGSFKPKTDSGSIFGDGMMSEKSLDEVILAYLAEDLDDSKKR